MNQGESNASEPSARDRQHASPTYAFEKPVDGSGLPFTGERYVPEVGDQIQHEHFHRYLFALEFCRGKDVVDVGCGEGYGTALIGTVASTIVGVDSSSELISHADSTST